MTETTNGITATNIKYLTVIYTLSGKERFVKCSDIAQQLSVSRPTVHAMMRTLSRCGYIQKSRYGKVTLTQSGSSKARIYSQSYESIYQYMSKICPEKIDMAETVYTFMAQVRPEHLADICKNIVSEN